MRKRPLAAAAAFAAAAILFSTAPEASAAPVPGIRGRLVDASGNGVAGRTVVLYSDGTADESEAAVTTRKGVPLDVLGTAVTDAAGTFVVSPSPAGLARASARKDRALAAAGRSSASARTPLPVLLLVDGGAAQYGGEISPAGDWGGTDPTITLAEGVGSAAIVPLADGSGACPTYFPYRSWWQLSSGSSYIDSATVVGRADTGAKTTNTMVYAQSDTTTSEMFGGSSSSAVLAAAGQKRLASNSASTTFATAANSGRSYRITSRYRPYDLMCSNDSTGKVWVTPTYQWRPTIWTGGTSYLSFTRSWTCQAANRATISSPLSIGKSSSVSDNYSAGVSINGYGGTTAVTRTSATEVNQTWKLVSGYASANLCGRTGVPSQSLEIAEV